MTLGRERKSVDYCLTGNGNIGRVHARIVVRDDKVYIVDNNSTNGTYVNNTKLRAGQEQLLHNGDIVKLADEKFRYSL
jgi:pSer/pThr/pTyr-binding forkhead associated (FHA) protein